MCVLQGSLSKEWSGDCRRNKGMAWRPYDSGDEMNLDETKVPLGDGKAWGCTEWAVREEGAKNDSNFHLRQLTAL